ncbi:MAG: NAD(P)H-hydrate dehydratase [Terriglobales bacterium]
MRVLTAEQMRGVDAATVAGGGQSAVSAGALMEAAGTAATAHLLGRFPEAAAGPITVICGKGNNGGDGLVVARQLRQRGAAVRVILLTDPATLRGAAAEKWAALQSLGAALHLAPDAGAWASAKPALSGARLWVDAIFGTGLAAPPRGYYAQVIADLNRVGPRPPVLAIDLPSGLAADGEWSSTPLAEWDWEAVIRAQVTVTFTAPKLGAVMGPGVRHCGELWIAGIGSPAAVVDQAPPAPAPPGWGTAPLSAWLTTAADCAAFLQPRPSDAHKGRFGHVLVLGGSVGKSGAVAMAGEAALRIGVGLVTAAVPRAILPSVAAYRPELMTEPLAETADGGIAAGVLEANVWGALVRGKTVTAVGPGLSARADVAATAREMIVRLPVPWVLDADGLNAFAGRAAELRSAARSGVLTPHPGEMARLLAISTTEVQQRRLACARRLAAESGAVVVLKGYRTLIADPTGRLYINPTGNPGLATGGAGDILTGILAGLWAQYPAADALRLAAAAVYLHGLAGDIAADEIGEMPLCATDITRCLPTALRRARAAANDTEDGQRLAAEVV